MSFLKAEFKMKSILVSSVEGYSGKSAVIIALGVILREKGFKVGYFKPFGVGITRIGGQLVDADVYNTAIALNTDYFVFDRLLVAEELLGDRLKFVLFNQLAGYKKVYVRGIAERFLERNGMELLGTLPYDPLLAGLYMIFGKARIRGDAKIRRIKELVKILVVDLERLGVK